MRYRTYFWLVLLFVVVMGLVFYITVENGTKELVTTLEDIKEAILLEDWDRVHDAVKVFDERWMYYGGILEILMEHTYIHEIDFSWGSLKANIEMENKEEGYPAVEELIRIVAHLKEREEITIQNILRSKHGI